MFANSCLQFVSGYAGRTCRRSLKNLQLLATTFHSQSGIRSAIQVAEQRQSGGGGSSSGADCGGGFVAFSYEGERGSNECKVFSRPGENIRQQPTQRATGETACWLFYIR